MKQQSGPCVFSEEELLLACYGELDSARRQLLQEHLRSCAVCQQEYARLGDILMSLRPTTLNCAPAALQQFTTRLTRRIGRRTFLPPLRLAGATLAIVAVVFLAPWQSDFFLSGQTPLPSQPTGELSMIEVLDFYQNMEMLELLDLFVELEPLG